MEVVASLSQGRTAAAQCGLFMHKSVPVIYEPPCRKQATTDMTVTHTTVKQLTRVVQRHGHKLHIQLHFFS